MGTNAAIAVTTIRTKPVEQLDLALLCRNAIPSRSHASCWDGTM